MAARQLARGARICRGRGRDARRAAGVGGAGARAGAALADSDAPCASRCRGNCDPGDRCRGADGRAGGGGERQEQPVHGRASRGVDPDGRRLSASIDLALAAGAHDEAVRAVVNYLWSAALLGPLEPVEQLVEEMTAAHLERGLNAEAYGEYLRVSLAALIYVPTGRWAEADAVVAGESHVATNRLVWLWVVAGLALRRGDLELVDRLPAGASRDRAGERGATADPPDGERRDAASAARRRPRRGEGARGHRRRAPDARDLVLAVHDRDPAHARGIGDADHLEALLRTLSELDGRGERMRRGGEVTRGLLALLGGEPHEAARILSSAEADSAHSAGTTTPRAWRSMSRAVSTQVGDAIGRRRLAPGRPRFSSRSAASTRSTRP